MAKLQRPAVPPVAPTSALRAATALSDAHRFLGAAMCQAFMAAMWALLLVTKLEQDRSIIWHWGLGVLLFAVMAGLVWASMQGQRLGNPPYSSGQSPRVRGAARYVLVASLGWWLCGLMLPVAMFVTWTNGIPFPNAIGLLQIAILLGQLLLCVFMILRAIDALKYAGRQLIDRVCDAVNE